jgi:hypothetical protein
LLGKFAHSRNLLTEFARSIEKLLTMKNLAGSDGSTRWLNVSHQANRSTAGAHHSTVSVVTAGTCWAGPSRILVYSMGVQRGVLLLCIANSCFNNNITHKFVHLYNNITHSFVTYYYFTLLSHAWPVFYQRCRTPSCTEQQK